MPRPLANPPVAPWQSLTCRLLRALLIVSTYLAAGVGPTVGAAQAALGGAGTPTEGGPIPGVRADAEARAQVTIGIGGEVVAGAWNPVRVSTRDLPASTLVLSLDVGTLKSGEVPVDIEYALPGGGGVVVSERPLFIPPFRSLSWRIRSADRVVASGSLSSRRSDERRVLLVLQEPGRPLPTDTSAVWPSTRAVEVGPSDLPSDPAAYGGVAGVLVSHPSPPAEGLLAAAVAGAQVVFTEPLTFYSGAATGLLEGRTSNRLGAGSASTGGAGSEPTSSAVDSASLLSAALGQPLVRLPSPAPRRVIVLAALAYLVVVALMLRFGGAQGTSAALLLALLCGVAAWSYARPSAPQFEGRLAVGIVGGELALMTEAVEQATLPRATLPFPASASPFVPQEYSATEGGVDIPTAAWRQVVVRLPPRAVTAPFTVQDNAIRSRIGEGLSNSYVVGLGSQLDTPPGGLMRPVASEEGVFSPRTEALYLSLVPLLPSGSVLTTTGCATHDDCTIWIAPAAIDVAAARAAAGAVRLPARSRIPLRSTGPEAPS